MPGCAVCRCMYPNYCHVTASHRTATAPCTLHMHG
jgi:hypothetical protein